MAAALARSLLAGLASLFVAGGDPSPQALIDAGHFKRARAIVEPRVQANSNDAEAAYVLSQVRLAFGDDDTALKLAEKAVALDGKNAKYHFQLAQVYGSMAQKAGLFKQMGLARHFKSEAETAASLDPKYLDARTGLIEFYLQAPGIAGGDKKKAQSVADEIARIDPAQGFVAQARLAQEQKDTTKEEQFYLKAIQANPKDYDVQVSLGNFYATRLKKNEQAEQHAQAALQLDAGRADGYVTLAQLFADQKRWADLDTILQHAEKNVPDDFTPYYQAGKTLLLQGSDLARGERYFRKYLTQEPEGGAPDLAAGHWRLGLVLEKEGRKQEAISELQTAVKLKPDFDQAKKDLKRVK